HHLRVVTSTNRIGSISLEAINELERHQAHAPVHSHYSGGIIPYGADRAGYVRAVSLRSDCSAVERKVVTMNVVNESITVVVDAVRRCSLAGICPDVGGK